MGRVDFSLRSINVWAGDISMLSILVFRYSKKVEYGSKKFDDKTFHEPFVYLSITLIMVRTGRGMCDVIPISQIP